MNKKEYAIDTLELAQWNVLRSIMRLKPEDLEYKLTPNHNPIRWILGHLIWQLDLIFNRWCQGLSKLSEEQREYFTSGAEGFEERPFPFTLRLLIDTFLDISEASFEYLRGLPEEEFNKPPAMCKKKDDETIYELIQRASLHFLGHTGQIYWIKRGLGKGGYFVTGVRKKGREESRKKWMKWWNDTKEEFGA